MKAKASDVLKVMQGWVGMSRSKGTHKPIIDLYNAHKPLARGYKVKYTDAYCATTVSAAFIASDAVELIGATECGCEEFIKIFKRYGIWQEDGTITPPVGAIILYNWDIKAQPNDGTADHIGIVENVEDGRITVVEGNMNGNVARREINVGYGCIRGYALPEYAPEADENYTVGWHQSGDDGRWWYQYEATKNGYYRSTIERINGKLYAFDKEGWMKEGQFSVTADEAGALDIE